MKALRVKVITVAMVAFIASAVIATPIYMQRIRIYNEDRVAPNGGMSRPQLLTYVTPAYTSAAAERGVVGVVSFLAEFDINGDFQVFRLVKGLGFGLDESALAAVNQWHFQPAFRSGRRVSVVSQIDVFFDPREQMRMINELVKAYSQAGMSIKMETPEGTFIFKEGTFGGEPKTIPQMKISGVF